MTNGTWLTRQRLTVIIVVAIIVVAAILVFVFRDELGITALIEEPETTTQGEQLAQQKENYWKNIELEMEAVPAQGETVIKGNEIKYTATLSNKNNVGQMKRLALGVVLIGENAKDIVYPEGAEVTKNSDGNLIIDKIDLPAQTEETISFSTIVPAKKANFATEHPDGKIKTIATLAPKGVTKTIDQVVKEIEDKLSQQEGDIIIELDPYNINSELIENASPDNPQTQNSPSNSEPVSENTGSLLGEVVVKENPWPGLADASDDFSITKETTPVEESVVAPGESIDYKFELSATSVDVPRALFEVSLPFSDSVAQNIEYPDGSQSTGETGMVQIENIDLQVGQTETVSFTVDVPSDTSTANYCAIQPNDNYAICAYTRLSAPLQSELDPAGGEIRHLLALSDTELDISMTSDPEGGQDGAEINPGDTLNFTVSVGADQQKDRSLLYVTLPFSGAIADIESIPEGSQDASETGTVQVENINLNPTGTPATIEFSLEVPEDFVGPRYCGESELMVCTRAELSLPLEPDTEKAVTQIGHLLGSGAEQPEPVAVQPKVASVYHVRGNDELLDAVEIEKKVKKSGGQVTETLSAAPGDSIEYVLTAKNGSENDISEYLMEDNLSDVEPYAEILSVKTEDSEGRSYSTTYSDSIVKAAVPIESGETITTTIAAQIKPQNSWPSDNDGKMTNAFLEEATEVGVVAAAADENAGTGTGTQPAATKTAEVETGIDSSVLLVLIYSGLAVVATALVYITMKRKA